MANWIKALLIFILALIPALSFSQTVKVSKVHAKDSLSVGDRGVNGIIDTLLDDSTKLVTSKAVKDAIDGLAMSAGGSDGVATAGAYDAINEEIDITVASPGSSFSFDVSALLDNTDSQDLSFLGTTLTLTDGGSVDLSSLQDGTGTDDQTATEVSVTPSGNLTSTNVQAALEEHQADIDALASGGSDGVITSAAFNGATDNIDVTVAAPGSSFSFDVSALLDNTDSQDLSLTGNTLSLTGDATTVDLSSYLDNTDSQAISLTGNTLSITGNASTVDLSAYLDNTDTQLTQAQVEDFAGGIFTGNTETLITATYQGSDNTLDLVVQNDLSLYDNSTSGFLTSEVDGSITNEIQTFDQTLAEGSTLTANRAVTLSGNSFQVNGAASQLQMDANSGLLTSLNGSLDFGDISTTAADIVLRHRLSGDVADQDYLYLNSTGLDLAHRNAITLASDTMNWNTGIVSMGQNITVNSNNNSILYSMTGAGDFDITTNSSDVLIKENYIDQVVDAISGGTRILQGFGAIEISRFTNGDTGYPDFFFMNNDTLALRHTSKIVIDAPIVEINGSAYSGGGGTSQTLSVSNDDIVLSDSGGSVSVINTVESNTAGSTTITIDLQSARNRVVQIDMTSASTASTVTLSSSNPITGGVYTFHFQSTNAGGHDVDFPATFLNAAGAAWDGSTTVNYTEDDWLTCYYDGTNYHCK